MISHSIARSLSDRRLDQLFEALRSKLMATPEKGWLHEIRSALRMTAAQHARRIGIAPSTLSRLEQSEVKKSISLASLERAADALGCDVHYILVPREPLRETLLRRALEILRKERAEIVHSMALEGQAPSTDDNLREVIEATLLIESGDRRLWDDKK